MLNSKPILVAVAVLLVVSLACSFSASSVPTPDSNFVSTAVAQTIIARSSQTLQAVIPITGLESPTATFTPVQSPTPTLSPTPIFTSTPSVPQITVSVATNCREGPGKVYDRVGALLVGEVAEVFGVDPTGNYWYIRNPDSSSDFCWLWGEYATLAGNLAFLPVYTPPPTPTPAPAFTATFDSLDSCVGWWVDIDLKNTGGVTFKSVSITLRDTNTSTVLSMSVDGFTDNDGCSSSSTRDNLNPGGSHIVSLPPFAYDPTGHKLRATITLCSNTGSSGMCVSQVINFKP